MKNKIPFRQRLATFMYGRYGGDQLTKFLSYFALLLVLVNLVFRSYIISALVLIMLIFSIFRMFSKNLYQRRKENDLYLKVKGKITGFFKLTKNKIRDRKTHVYKKCPDCKAVIRLPKKKGEHTVCCPQCKKRFDVKI